MRTTLTAASRTPTLNSARRPRQLRALVLALATVSGTGWAQEDAAVKALVDQGKYWQARGRADRAAEAWQKLLRLNPSSPDALYGLGVAELESGRAQAAQSYLDQLKKASPNSPLVKQLSDQIARGGTAGTRQSVEQARELARSGKSEEAVRQYEKATGGVVPQGDLALEYYQTLGGTAQGWDAARQGLERIARANPSDMRAQLALAQHLTYRESTRREGIRQLERLAGRPDVGKDATESWRRALGWLGTRPADAPLFQQWLASHPDDAEIRARLETATRRPERGATAGPAPAPADPLRGVVQQGFNALDDGDLERAASRFQSVLAQRPNDADALGGMGVLRLKQEQFAEAVDYFNKAQRAGAGAGARYRQASNSANYWLLVRQASAAREAGNLAEARSLLERAQRLDPNEATGQVALADIQAGQRQYAVAEASYRRVLKAHPGNADATRGLIDALIAQGRNNEAVTLAQELTPAQRNQLGGLGRMRAEQARAQARQLQLAGDSAGARRALEDAMAADPTDPWVRLEVARNYLASGMKDQARAAMDNLLASNPGNPDALYASALAASEAGEWQRGLDLLEQVPAGRRTRDMGNLQRRMWVHAESERASELAKAGQQAAALGVLQQAERYAQQDAELTGAIAQGYADAGDDAQALNLMRSAMRRSVVPDVGMQLQYAAILLKTNQDMELAGLLRQIAGANMTAQQRRGYDDLRVAYIVRQADALTQAGDLVGAYDTLAPALSERGGSPAVRGSLARMYAKAGENQKALALYESVLQRDPNNLELRLAAIGTATAAKEYSWAEKALEPALKQAPDSVEVLTAAGRLYKAQGRNSKAADYFRAAVAVENRTTVGVRAPAGTGFDRVPQNPFVGLPGQRQASSLPQQGSIAPYQPLPAAPAAAPVASVGMAGEPYIPLPASARQQAPAAVPVQTPGSYYTGGTPAPAPAATTTRGATTTRKPAAAPATTYAASPASNPYPAPAANPASSGYAQPYGAQTYAQPYAAPAAVPVAAAATPQPLGAQSRLPWLADVDSPASGTARTGPLTAAEELREIEQQRTSTLAGGPILRGRSGDSGQSQLTEISVVAEGKKAVGDGKLVARVTPVALDAGDVGSDFNNGSRFGGGPQAWAVPNNPTPTSLTGQRLPTASAGTQSAAGVALNVAYESDRFSADIGSTPLGFRFTNVAGGARLNLPMSERSNLSLSAARRPVTDSLLSYAGAKDDRAGVSWGGVMSSGGRADLGWDDGSFGLYGYGGYSVLTGHDVARNNKWEGGGGFYMRVIDEDTQRLTGGLNFTSMGYSENLRYFTFGQGGYFSPQSYFAVTLPLTYAGRSGRLSYHVRGALGVQAFHEDDSQYFPTDAARQAQANQAIQIANGSNLTSQTQAIYPGQSKTGLAYNLVGGVEYQASQQLFVGGTLGVDNARDYRQWYAGVYVRYALQRQTGPIMFPPVPPQSAVGPLPF